MVVKGNREFCFGIVHRRGGDVRDLGLGIERRDVCRLGLGVERASKGVLHRTNEEMGNNMLLWTEISEDMIKPGQLKEVDKIGVE